MKRVLVHSQSIEQTQAIKKHLEFYIKTGINFEFSTDIEKTETLLTSKSIQLLIFDTNSFNKRVQKFVRDIRLWGLSTSVLVTCEDVTSAAQLNSYVKDDAVHFIEYNYEPKKMAGIVKKLLQTRRLPQQVFPRYHTNQLANIEVLTGGFSIDSSMYNLSKGGAYFELEDVEEPCRVGDFLKFSIDLDETDTQHSINAKVVWATKRGRYSGRYGVGVKFVSSHEIYKHLVEKL